MSLAFNEISVMLHRKNLVMPECYFSSEDSFEPSLVETLNQHQKILCIADKASHLAAHHVIRNLSNINAEICYQIFDAPIDASIENAARILYAITELNVTLIVALGSGSINDLCKYAAFQSHLHYICIPTAPSMNGYTSINASLKHQGLKQSFMATLPQALFIDTNVIANAPKRMIAAGIADSMASASAMLDWKLSHLVLDTEYIDMPFLKSNPLLTQTTKVPIALMHQLLAEGFAMTIAGSSAPASGGEHMLAHQLEMDMPDLCAPLLHGELVAHCLLVYAEHQRRICFSQTPPQLIPWKTEPDLKAIFGIHWQTIQPIAFKKQAYIAANQNKINERFAHYWPKWQPIFASECLSDAQMATLQSQPLNQEIIEHCKAILHTTRYTRNRFTCSDIAA